MGPRAVARVAAALLPEMEVGELGDDVDEGVEGPEPTAEGRSKRRAGSRRRSHEMVLKWKLRVQPNPDVIRTMCTCWPRLGRLYIA